MFATIFLIRKVTGYWEGRGQGSFLLPSSGIVCHWSLSLSPQNNRKIYRSGSSKLMSDDRRGWTHRNADLSLWNLLLMFATFFPTSLLTKTRESQSIWCFVHRKWNLWIFNQKPWGGWGGCDHDNEEVTEEGRRVGWSIIYSLKSTYCVLDL